MHEPPDRNKGLQGLLGSRGTPLSSHLAINTRDTAGHLIAVRPRDGVADSDTWGLGVRFGASSITATRTATRAQAAGGHRHVAGVAWPAPPPTLLGWGFGLGWPWRRTRRRGPRLLSQGPRESCCDYARPSPAAPEARRGLNHGAAFEGWSRER